MSDHDNTHANSDNPLEARIKSTLDHACADLDPRVQRRLDRIRSQALASASSVPAGRRFLTPPWSPLAAGVAAAAVALALAVIFVDSAPQTDPPPMTADLDLLTDPRFELFVEDPEFVAWIAEAEPEAPSTEDSG